jgi:hypothetical protein
LSRRRRGGPSSRHRRNNSGESAKWPQVGEFANLFADRARTPVRTFLPEHRVWQALAAVAGATAVLTGIVVGSSQVHFAAAAEDPRLRTLGLATAPEQHAQSSPVNAGSSPVSGGSDGRSQQLASSRPPRSNAAPPLAATPAASPTPNTPLAPPTADTPQRDTTQQTNSAPPAHTSPASSTLSFSVKKAVDTGGSPYWAEDVLSITSNTPLSALKIAVHVAQTGGVASTGTWTSLSGQAKISVSTDSNGVNYLLTLNPGVTLAPGTYTFEAQYNHAQGNRNSQHDLYTITATPTGSSTSESTSDHF